MRLSSHIFAIRLSISALALVLACLCSCNRRSVKLTTDAVEERGKIPVLSAHQVNTLISDSGITRYRIVADTWLVFDKADTPHWEFPEGIYLERFSPDYTVDAYLQADYAFYNQRERVWRLSGNVHTQNLQGEKFETSELFWSQNEERIYSDSAISITRATSIIHGVGFESNQQMSKYVIRRPTGIIPINETDSL